MTRLAAERRGWLLVAAGLLARAGAAEPQHGIAMYGEPALPPDFVSLPYANPDAPEGRDHRLRRDRRLRFAQSVHPAGPCAGGVQTPRIRDADGAELGRAVRALRAAGRSIETGPDREWVEFTLRPEARFSDGSPVTVEDVVWSMQTLAEHGLPRYRNAWEKVASVEQTGERSVRFAFSEPDARAAADHRAAADPEEGGLGGVDFEASSLRVPVGSGPYVVGALRARALHQLRAQPGLLGSGPADQPRA